MDVIGIFFLVSLPDIKIHHKVKKTKNILEILKDAKVSKALHVSIYV
jgi:hypothetical protein